ncbi:NnrS family protein [Pseudoalteromonas sp. JBTF-M23]|uniref:NnrS family protein n=1 Tax=Pseudoalteromonas caenipelagi TaxID=2726988 RepID=A0A849VDE0_9GAMM|nr:NnrS family protein [Pseudoalteromonas caenipelagi]NOU49944.1 NnrS family protein [Pseudoalteromonas caenipelagi]
MRTINLAEPIPTQAPWYDVRQWPIFMLAFRPMFLGAATWAVVSIALWAGILSGTLIWDSAIPATLWHAHEMIFGFAGAVAVGFLLTAAQNWTNVPSINGVKLALLVSFWLAARYVFFAHPTLLAVTLTVQTAFWLIAIICLSSMLLRARSKNNYVFIAILCALCTFNTLFFILLLQQNFELARSFTHIAVLLFMLLIGIVGGRVIPFFTARGLALNEQVRTPKLDRLLLWTSVLGIIGFVLSQVFMLPLNPGYLIALAALMHLARSILWFQKRVIFVPLLWSLHLGYALSALGLALVASSLFTTHVYFNDALHLITLGGIGLTIMAMMARVSLGHTGRPLHVPVIINIAFITITLGALCRTFLPYFISPHQAWLYSAALWCASFSLFVYHYFNVLTQKRVDGRRG